MITERQELKNRREQKSDMEKELTYKQIRKNQEINILLERGNEVLGSLGYTDHSAAHAA